jgi:hypothetical protein
LLPLQLPDGADLTGLALEPVQLLVGVGAEVGAAFEPLQLLCVEVTFVVTPVPPFLPVQLLSALPVLTPTASPAPASKPAIPNPAKYFFRSLVSIDSPPFF